MHTGSATGGSTQNKNKNKCKIKKKEFCRLWYSKYYKYNTVHQQYLYTHGHTYRMREVQVTLNHFLRRSVQKVQSKMTDLLHYLEDKVVL